MPNKWKRLRAIAKSLSKGASITAACEAAGIRRVTLWRWRKANPKINNYIEEVLENQIEVVEDALYRRATGYIYEEVTKEREESVSEKRIAKVVTKQIAPDTTAIMFYLMNRAPHRWADKRALVNNYINNVNALGKKPEDPFKDIPVPVLKRMVADHEGKIHGGNGNGQK